jgi:ABC-type bacteriocin/lantibiotic exporter with double-glycine peptidase domain
MVLSRNGRFICWLGVLCVMAWGIVVFVRCWPAASGLSRVKPFSPAPCHNSTAGQKGCGPATLYCICKLDGKNYSLQQLRELSRTSSSGTTMLSLRDAAERVGFLVDARRGGWHELSRHVRCVGAYAIVHATLDGSGHFVGVVGAPRAHRVRVVDVITGVRDYDNGEFSETYAWDGSMLLLHGTADRGEKQ